ncbi:MAG TPA: alpha/beta hydrolase [Candidatus Acidoferrum sp.]|nr:alpha/beta hydrolase [Candidatus Acidoferrum sp.]
MDYDSFEDGYAQTSLGPIHFRHHSGKRDKLIFLHGLGASTLSWKRLMEFIPDDIDVYLVDLLGHGESDAPELDYSVSLQFQALREFISLQNNGDSYIFGHSYGAWVAAYYASQPCSCRGIILEDCAGVKEMFDEMKANGTMDEHAEQLFKEAMKSKNNEQVIRSSINSGIREDQLDTEILSDIGRRTLIIWGANDAMSPVKYSNVLQSKIKGSQLDIVEGAGHVPHFEKPGEVSKILLKFMKY